MKKVLFVLCFLLLFLPKLAFAESLDFNNGHYEVEVALWHAYEDKLSMGSEGVKSRAEIVKDDEKTTLYLELKPITVASLTTSVKRFFLLSDKEKAYLSGEPHQYDIVLEGKSENRPSIFSFNLEDKKNLYFVLVDPDVPQMGTDPIKARLFIDWQTLKPVSGNESLKDKVDNEIKAGDNHLKYSKGEVALLNVSEKGEFSSSPLTRKFLEEKGLKVAPLAKVKGYELAFNEPILKIPEDKTTNVNELAGQIEFSKLITVKFSDKGYDEVWQWQENKFVLLKTKKTNEGLEIETKQLGVFALVSKVGSNNNLMPSATKQPTLPFISKNQPKKVSLPSQRMSLKKVVGKVAKVSRNDVQQKALALKKETSTAKTEEGTDLSSQVEPRERYGIIAFVIAIYVGIFLVGLWLWKLLLPNLKRELDRKRYLYMLAHKEANHVD